MKVPVSTTLYTPSSTPNNNNNNTRNNLCYEPTSVLDLQQSPSPRSKPSLNNHNHHHRSTGADLDNLEGWDTILSELGLNDDNSSNPNYNSKLLLSHLSSGIDSQDLHDFPSSQPLDHTLSLQSDYSTPFSDFSYTPNLSPHFGPFDLNNNHNDNAYDNNNNTPTTFGLDFLNDLVRASHAFETNDSHHLNLVLTRLNQRLRSPNGKPLRRAAFYFKEALQNLSDSTINTATTPSRPAKLSSYDVVQTIRAQKTFSTISPISLFSALAVHQAILEAVDGASVIHIVDFDINFGGHWASFMRELVDKAIDVTSIALRITAIVPEEFSLESKLVRENLSQFALELNLNFRIDFVLIPTFEILSFKSVKFIDGERIAVHLSPSIFHRFAYNFGSILKFVTDLRGVSPRVVVVVDKEVGIDVNTTSFGVSFVAGIEFYTGMLESLDATAGDGDCVRKIETFVIKPRIMTVVKAAARAEGRRSTWWREAISAAGMRVVGFSQFADFQAEGLLRRAQVAGFQLAKRQGEMVLFWHDRPLVATSAWMF